MKLGKKTQIALAVATVGLAAGAVVAGTDTTFGAPTTKMQAWLEGSMGKLFSIGSLAVGLGIGIVKQSVMSVAIGTGIALAASAGPAVLSTIFSAAL